MLPKTNRVKQFAVMPIVIRKQAISIKFLDPIFILIGPSGGRTRKVKKTLIGEGNTN